jgi:hypothetical protein
MQVGTQEGDSVNFMVVTDMAGLKRMLSFAVSGILDGVPRTVTCRIADTDSRCKEEPYLKRLRLP